MPAPSADFLGLPQPVIDILQHRVSTSHVIRTPQVYETWERTGTIPAIRRITGIRQATRTVTLPGYALNIVYDRVHGEDYIYLGEQGGSHVFRKYAVHFSLNGTDHTVPASTMYVNADGSIDTVTEQVTYTVVINRQRVTLTAQELADRFGVAVDQILEWDRDTIVTQERNPETHICNVFAAIGDGHESYLLINGIETSNYSEYITAHGTRTSLVLHHLHYNGCTAENADPACGSEAGNFGLCSKNKMYIFDLYKDFAITEYRYCEQPESGKEFRISAYYDWKEKQQLHSLPRIPVPGAIYY